MSSTPPLEGLRVLELAGVLAGPAAGMFLAELGADVIKVENPSTNGDVTRAWRLPDELRDGDTTAYFHASNWGKRSIAIDLTREAGRALVHDLARRADVVLASYRPGQAQALGVDPDTLLGSNPGLVYAEITAYGTGDPRPGYDALLQAGTGFMSINGEPGGRPLKMPVALIDLLAAHQLKEAILLALLERERSGAGRHVSVSLVRSGLASLANQATGWLATGRSPEPLGSGHPSIVPYGEAWDCAGDDSIVLAVGTDRQFAGLCDAIGAPELSTDARYRTNADRVRNRDALRRDLAPRIRALHREPLLSALADRGVPAGPVNDVAEALQSVDAGPLLLGTGERAGLRTVAIDDGIPTVRDLAPPPGLSEHARAVLADPLGLAAEDAEALFASGIVLRPRDADD